VRLDAWRGVKTREQVIEQALFDVLHDDSEVESLFLIIMQQNEY